MLTVGTDGIRRLLGSVDEVVSREGEKRARLERKKLIGASQSVCHRWQAIGVGEGKPVTAVWSGSA